MAAGPLTRRAILAGLAGANVIARRPNRVAAQTDNDELDCAPHKTLAWAPRKVLILGAGMAGLTAALALVQRGHDVTVIERQDRVGGRLLSVPLPEGQVSEAGGGHFRSNMPLVLAYLRRYGLPVLSLNDGLPRYLIDGEIADAADLANWPWDLTAEERQVTVASNLNRYLYRNGLDTLTVLQPDWPDPATIARLDALTLADLVRNAGGSDAFVKLLDAHGGLFTGASSALGVLPDLAYHFGDQNLFRIAGGNELLPRAIARELGDHVVLGASVTALDQSGPRIRVTVADGRTFSGDAVISTIPFSVITNIDVQPAWSAGKQRMFQAMTWGNTVKVIAQTRTPAWLSSNVHGWPMAGGDRPWERVIDITGNEPGGAGNTFFYLNGRNATAYLAQPTGSRRQAVVAAFQTDLPGLFDEVMTLDEFAWSEQPWVRGSFGDLPVNGAWMIAEWTRPEDRVHFAGDFTSLKTGWVEGAIESGLRAASQIDPAVTTSMDPLARSRA